MRRHDPGNRKKGGNGGGNGNGKKPGDLIRHLIECIQLIEYTLQDLSGSPVKKSFVILFSSDLVKVEKGPDDLATMEAWDVRQLLRGTNTVFLRVQLSRERPGRPAPTQRLLVLKLPVEEGVLKGPFLFSRTILWKPVNRSSRLEAVCKEFKRWLKHYSEFLLGLTGDSE